MRSISSFVALVALVACTPNPPSLEQEAQAVVSRDLSVWVPKVTMTHVEAARAREALEQAGLPVYLVLPGHVLVTAASPTPPPSAAFEPLFAARTWSTRATSVQSRSTALAETLLRGRLRPPPAPDLIDEAVQVEDELAAVRASLEAERAAATHPLIVRRVEQDLATLAAETTALTAAPLIGTPASSKKKYLRGAILVYCLFVESTGTGNENWTSTEVDDELADYAASLLDLARVAPAEYGVSFTLDHIPASDPRMYIDHEPSNGVNERAWIVEVLRQLGYNGIITASYGTQRLEQDLIAEYGVREATVVYVARDEEQPKASFADYQDTAWPHAGYNSYAITNSDFNGPVLIHELLHTFNAGDEYVGSGANNRCRASSGIGHDRAVEAGAGSDSNANHEECQANLVHQDCLMRSASFVRHTPFDRPVLCWHTRAQIGWRDTAAVRARLTGLPSSDVNAFSPSLLTHIDSRPFALTESFSYVEQGGVFFGGRRCAQQTATGQRFTTTGDVVSCNALAFRSASVAGGPGDIRVGSEGRVLDLLVPYSPIDEEPCGDGVCDLTETAATCAADCRCGNQTCDLDESVVSCPADCAFCGDDVCTPGETRANCPVDCSPSVPLPGGT